jgi:hypothetical protein
LPPNVHKIFLYCVARKHIKPSTLFAPHIRKLFEWDTIGNYSILEEAKKANSEALHIERREEVS